MSDWSEMFSAEELVAAQEYARRTVARILSRRDPEAIEDVLQNAAIKAMKKFRQFRGDATLNSWFTRIAINEALQVLRRSEGSNYKTKGNRYFVSADVLEAMPSREYSPYKQAALGEIGVILSQEISELSCSQRVAARQMVKEIGPRSGGEKSARFYARQELKRRLIARGVKTCFV